MIALIVILVLVGIVVLFFAFLFFVALLENHIVEALVPVERESLAEPSAYFKAVNESARKLGFEYIGAYRVNRTGRLYGEYITLWLSPDQTTLARIGGGKTAGVTAKKTSLLSYLTSNYIIETTDAFGTRDLSGLTDKRLLLNAQFEELFTLHGQRLTQMNQPPRPIKAANAFEIHQSLGLMKITRLKELGLARFTNTEQTVWRYTLNGALQICGSVGKGSREASAQQERRRLKRPGDY